MEQQETVSQTRQENKLHFSQLAAYGAGGIIPIALFNVAGILVGLMGNISLGLSAFWLGVILIIPRLWDALSDPIIGHLSDNTRTRWGRRRPYLLVGGLLVAITFVIMWWIPKGDMVRAWFPSESGYQWFQLVYILFTLLLFFTAVNIFEIPHGALGMEMTTDYHERTRLFSAKSFVGNLFAMSTPWLFALANMEIFKGPGGNEADGMRYVSLMIAAVLIPLAFWWTYRLREPGFVKAATHEKTPFWQDMKRTAGNRNFIMLTLTIFTLAMGFNFVQLLGSYIPIFYVFGGDKIAGARLLGINGTVWAITGLLAVFPLNLISPKLGKRNTLTIAILLMVTAQLSKIVCYNPEYPFLILIPTILLSAGMLFFFTLGSSMVGDICDEDELKTGYRAEGSFYSIFWWFIKMGTALASFVAGALIVLTLFDETQVTRVDALKGDIREIRSSLQVWVGYPEKNPDGMDWVILSKEKSEQALTESKEYFRFLERESLKNQDEKGQYAQDYPAQRMARISQAKAVTQSAIKQLESVVSYLSKPQHDERIQDSLVKVIIPVAIQTKMEKARMHAFELNAHLESKSSKSPDSQEHYRIILDSMAGINSTLRELNPSTQLNLMDQKLAGIEGQIVTLTKQTPYTLLMMRVVEIGLPILLSLLSLLFLLRYSLTEKRSHEIKNLLLARNSEQEKISS